jgi:hypothetical protein
MIRWFLERKLTAFERQFDYDVSYMRDILAANPRAFLRFYRSFALSAHRDGTPLEAWYAAKIATALEDDCGPCTQLVVGMAERAGVRPQTLRAILVGDGKTMPPDAALGYRFARAVLRHDIPESDALRKEVVARWGRKPLVALALTIAGGRLFPGVKYALGHGHACTRVRVGDTELVPVHKEEARV